jgi:hypothetical protein
MPKKQLNTQLTSKQVLNRGNWTDSNEGWGHWSTIYNDLLLEEAKEAKKAQVEKVLDSTALS